MNFKILKKDLKRKKSMNLILLIFVMLATTFIASSLKNMSVALRGTNEFFEIAGLKDYIIITMRESFDSNDDNDKKTEKFLDNQKDVDTYTKDNCLYLAKNNIKLPDERKITLNSTVIFSCYKINQQKFYDMKDNEITDMDDGSIYLPESFMNDNSIKNGDTVIISSNNGYKKEFRVVGAFKDAFLGAEMMGTHRYLVSEHDFDDVMHNSGLPYGMFYSVQTKNLKNFEKDYNNESIRVLFSGDQKLVKSTYILDMVITAVLLLVSICLILISIVMLRFIIIFTINEDYKEIGIMKAIGINDRGIRSLYITKYFIIAVVGSLIGFFVAIPFGNILLKQITRNIVVKTNNNGIWLQISSCIMVVVVITIFAYLSTGKIKKFSPMDAIRNGNNGERFKRKGFFRLKSTHFNTTTFLAYNDVISELKKYLTVLATSAVGIWLIVMPVNTINTLRSEKIAKWFSIQYSDVWIIDDDSITKFILGGEKQAYFDYLDDIKTTLSDNGVEVDNTFMEIMFRYKVRKEDMSYISFGLQGLGTDTKKYVYEQGLAPEYDNEIALAYTTANMINAEVGDTVYITLNDKEETFVVTALYQSMNNMGEGIRFTEGANLDYSSVAGGFGAQVNFKGDLNKEEYKDAFNKVKELYPNARIETTKEFISSMIGAISDRLDSLKILILILVTAINILVVVLMQKTFLIRERGEMAMMKSIGFSSKDIVIWQTKRIALVLFAGIVLGLVSSTPFSQITAGQVFKIMGASRIEFVINPLEVYALYPLIVLIITVLACVLTMFKVKKISVQDVNNIE